MTGIVLSADFETMEIKIRMRPRFDFKQAAPGHEAVVLSREEYEELTKPRVTANLTMAPEMAEALKKNADMACLGCRHYGERNQPCPDCIRATRDMPDYWEARV